MPRLDEMALGAPATAFGDLVLGNGGEEAGRRPTFLVGTGGAFFGGSVTASIPAQAAPVAGGPELTQCPLVVGPQELIFF